MEDNPVITTEDEDGEFLLSDDTSEEELDAMVNRLVDPPANPPER